MRHGRHKAVPGWSEGRGTEVFGGRSGEEVVGVD